MSREHHCGFVRPKLIAPKDRVQSLFGNRKCSSCEAINSIQTEGKFSKVLVTAGPYKNRTPEKRSSSKPVILLVVPTGFEPVLPT